MCTVSEDILELKSHLSEKKKLKTFLLKEFATQLERTSPKLKKNVVFPNFRSITFSRFLTPTSFLVAVTPQIRRENLRKLKEQDKKTILSVA